MVVVKNSMVRRKKRGGLFRLPGADRRRRRPRSNSSEERNTAFSQRAATVGRAEDLSEVIHIKRFTVCQLPVAPSFVPSLWTGIQRTVGALCEPDGIRLRVHLRLVLARSSHVSHVAPVGNDDDHTALKFARAFRAQSPPLPRRLVDPLSRGGSAVLCEVPSRSALRASRIQNADQA